MESKESRHEDHSNVAGVCSESASPRARARWDDRDSRFALGALTACSGSDDAPEGPSFESKVHGTLVHRYDVSPEHSVGFYDLGDTYFISEEFPIGETSLVVPLDSSLSLRESFRVLRPDVAVPPALDDAELRIAAVDKELRARADSDPTLANSVIDPLTGEARKVEQFTSVGADGGRLQPRRRDARNAHGIPESDASSGLGQGGPASHGRRSPPW